METLTIEAAGTQRQQADDAEGARVDALVLRQLEAWGNAELRDFIALADRGTGGYADWCVAQAARILDARRREFDPDFHRYSRIEEGYGKEFAGTTDEQVRESYASLGVREDHHQNDGENEPEEPERWDSCY